MRPWQVRDVMTTDVATVREKTRYRKIIDLLMGRRVSAVPVVDDFGYVRGVVSEADLLRSCTRTRGAATGSLVRRRHRPG